MATDDLNAPLGQDKAGKRRFPRGVTPPVALPHAAAGALGLFIVVFALWALIADDPLGGEPTAIVMADPPPGAKTPAVAGPAVGPTRYDGPETAVAAAAKPSSATQTITIIDGSSGKRQEVVVPGPDAKKGAPVDTKLLEISRHGPIPKIATDGSRPSEAYARKAPAAATNPDGPRIALIVGGLGVGASSTSDALSKISGPVTFAFAPYGSDLDNLVARARGEGHEVLLQVPMEPFDYPDNDPGPQTLLSSLSGRAECRSHAMADEPLPGLCRRNQLDGRALHGVGGGARAGAARNGETRPDLCRRRLVAAQPGQPDRGRQQSCRSPRLT